MKQKKSNEKPTRFLREEYIARINRVIDFIEGNLDKQLSLEKLARVANFSPYHFHRIFGAMVGETLNQFIQRIRVEKAAMQLVAYPKKSITEIAFDLGFSGSATFARAFKDYFAMSASEYCVKQKNEESKISKTLSKKNQTHRKMGKDLDKPSIYIDSDINQQKWRIKMLDKKQIQVEVKDMPQLPVVYVRHIGPYAGDSKLFENLFNKLCSWAGPRGLLRFPETKMLSVYHDDPKVTDENKLRLSVCISVPEDTEVDGEIGKMAIPGGKYAFARFELANDEYGEAWNLVFGHWLPESGYQPDDRPCFELYLNDPKEHPEGKCILDICIPVKAL